MDTFTKTAVSQDIANSILKTMNVTAEICQKKWTLLQKLQYRKTSLTAF